MSWQEPIVILIVAGAVVWLYRHLRRLLAVAEPGGGAACHGCDDCDDGPSTPAVDGPDRTSR